jgi:hypothetical protein
MLVVQASSPTDLFMRLAFRMLGPKTAWVDVRDSSKWMSYNNTFTVDRWNPEFTGERLFHVVGYRPGGSKFTTLTNHYVDEAALQLLTHEYRRRRKSRSFAIGMNFNRGVAGRGACLSGFDIIQRQGKPWVILYSKVVEFPKRFMADLRLVGWLINQRIGIDTPSFTWYVPMLFTTHRLFFKVMRNWLGDEQLKRECHIPNYRKWLGFNPGIIEGSQQNTLQFWKELSPQQKRKGVEINVATG